MRQVKVNWSYSSGFVICLLTGVVMGLVFTVAGTLIYLVTGNAAFEQLGVSLGLTVALYLAGFTVAGLIAGLLNPLARSAPGAMLLGVIATIPMAWGATVLLSGQAIPDAEYRFAILAVSLFFGSGIGYLVRKEFAGLTDVVRPNGT